MPQLSQSELSEYYTSGKTVILSYRRAYEIRYSNGTGGYILQQYLRQYSGLPFSQRGRFYAMTPEQAHNVTHGNS